MRSLLLIAAALTICLLSPVISPYTVKAAEDGKTQKIAILPLGISRTGQYSYLNTAIGQMLVTRLSQKEQLSAVLLELSEQEVQEIKERLQAGNYRQAISAFEADWLVEGNMYGLKDGLQVNLALYSAADSRPLSYGIKAEGPDEVMPAISEIADEVHRSILALDKQESEDEDTAAVDDGLSGFETPHPERDYKKGLYGGAKLFGGEDDDRFESRGVRRSSTIPLNVESLALGDLDGDGVNELVAASRSKIRVYHFADRRFSVVASYDFSPRIKIHAVNIGDPGNTGVNKLFVSGNNGRFPSSAVLTWSGSEQLSMLSEDIRWYIRPVWWPGRDVILVGQKDSPNISDRFLAPGVYQLSFDFASGRVDQGDKLLLPPKTNLFDFVAADLNGDGEEEIMVIDEREKLLVYDSVLNLIWVSSANYGGSKKFFGPPIADDDGLDYAGYNEVQQSQRRLVYIPGRMDVKDITGDGLPEVVVSSNEVGVSEYVENLRSYDGGSVACLSWRGGGLLELWRTNHITGYVADYAFDGDGTVLEEDETKFMNRLYVAQIPDATYLEKLLPGSDKSRILAYEMIVTKESPPAVGP